MFDFLVTAALQILLIIMEILKWSFNKASLSSNRLVAEVFKDELLAFKCSCVRSDGVLESQHHIKIRMLKNIIFFRITCWIQRTKPTCVNSKESAELFIEVILFNIGSRLRWNPKLFRVILKLKIGVYQKRVD